MSNIISCAAAICASTAVTYFGQETFDTPAKMATVSTGVDLAAYWGILLPQLACRDFKRLGGVTRDHAKTLLNEYAGLFMVMETIYVAGRSTMHYALQTMECQEPPVYMSGMQTFLITSEICGFQTDWCHVTRLVVLEHVGNRISEHTRNLQVSKCIRIPPR